VLQATVSRFVCASATLNHIKSILGEELYTALKPWTYQEGHRSCPEAQTGHVHHYKRWIMFGYKGRDITIGLNPVTRRTTGRGTEEVATIYGWARHDKTPRADQPQPSSFFPRGNPVTGYDGLFPHQYLIEDSASGPTLVRDDLRDKLMQRLIQIRSTS
jgi:hypothetical protein